MKKLFIILFSVLFLLPAKARSDCATISSNLTLDIPCMEFSGNRFGVLLDLYKNPSDTGNLYFKLGNLPASQSTSSCAFLDSSLNINVTCISYQGLNYSLSLQYYANPNDTQWYYWKLTGAAPAGDGQNRKPVAESISLDVDSTVPYIEQKLSAYDPDNDTINYELVSPASGTGYSSAYINPNGKLYLTHMPAGNNRFSISYRVSDGQLFSDQARVDVKVNYLSDSDKNTGRNDVSASDYAQFVLSDYNSTLFGRIGDQPTVPRSIDLSPNFPVPGDQGNQSSCVGWAIAYALKSYQEKVEIGWALNTDSHRFSPAFIYNQINGGQDRGSYIYEALQLAVDKGVATSASMPYRVNDYRTQPSAAAFAEASKFKAASWKRMNDTSQIKAALANRKPVVGGIAVYEQLMNLSGANSVYNTASGNNQGGHAITIVGYDDDKYGGAFKVINSWSNNWGDQGYFWMPYNFAANGILSEAYVLEDAENSVNVVPVDPEPTEPEPDYNTLPNLTVEDWNANYDPRPRGAGSLTYSVINNGPGTAPAGADINLMLSDNRDITTSDYYVVYETIPFDLKTGESVYRDEEIAIPFNFPDQLPSGTYYMALWVDDLDVLQESNENDNISAGNDTISVQNTLPDLQVKTWYAEWDGYGKGVLTYEVVNNGASATTSMDWYINLILDQDQVAGNGNELFLFYEPTNFILPKGNYIYRRAGENPAYFNLYETYDGYSVPSGTYYMALWVDDMDAEAESNELNNGSYSWGTVNVWDTADYYYGTQRSGLERSGTDKATPGAVDGTADTGDTAAVSNGDTDGSGKAYNGKKLPPADVVWKKVEITRMGNGGTRMKVLEPKIGEQMSGEDATGKNGNEEDNTIYSKTISARAKVIFPTTSSKPMP
ncbi:MAG: hypothetical protein HQK61_01395 [Desulfamplus sp.]|nr:hypothetical protein [Desulfamplus sp.]